jgi:CubicO group peptidase (beta-lactamase class C family)
MKCIKSTLIGAAAAAVAALAVTPHARAADPTSASAATTAVGAAARPEHVLDSADLSAWLDGFLPYALKSGDIAGAVVAVVKDGKVLVQSGYGYADVAQHVRMDPEATEMRIGSTSKLFTWTAVMQLVEQGKLDLNRNVDDYLDFKVSPASGRPVTLLDLMNHTGGFEEGLKGILATDPKALPSTEAYVKEHPRPFLFEPGDVPAYSNYGAALAGYITQRVSGEPFEHYVEQHIFLPLGMVHSTFEQPLPKRFKVGLSQGYRTTSTPPGSYELIVTRPAGSVTTTGSDMTHFMVAQLAQGRFDDHEILSGATAELMQSPSENTLPGFATMAHGFFYDRKNGEIVIGHGGDTVLFHAELDLLPERHVGIFYVFNSRGRDDAVYRLRMALFDDFMDRYFPDHAQPPEQPTLSSALRDAQEIAGRYQGSRRVEHGFLSVFYLLQQSVITANPDGTITAPKAFAPGTSTFHEVAPQIWHEVGGTRQLALRIVDGVKTVQDGDDPIEVLQVVPPLRSAPLNLTVLLASIVILVLTIVLWPTLWLIRRHYQAHSTESFELRKWWLALRVAAAFDLIYLAAWTVVLLPVLSTQLEFYSAGLDPVIRTLQVAGLLIIAAAVFGVWSVWRTMKLGASRGSRLRNMVVAAALLGVVWIAFMCRMISFSVNY